MFTHSKTRTAARHAICLLLAVVIVGASLTLGALGVDSLASNRPVVTITQIA